MHDGGNGTRGWRNQNGEVKTVSLSTHVSVVALLGGLLLTSTTWAIALTYERNTLHAEFEQMIDGKLSAKEEVHKEVHRSINQRLDANSGDIQELKGEVRQIESQIRR